jgi:hypothetical protein
MRGFFSDLYEDMVEPLEVKHTKCGCSPKSASPGLSTIKIINTEPSAIFQLLVPVEILLVAYTHKVAS